MASSSSATDSQVDYDVFLSFRGEDTRYNFISHLYGGLCRKNIKAFIDYDINRGEEITPFLERMIECVRLSIIVFSSGYASSTFCLDEMVKIMECRKTKGQIVLPIFYKVDPSEETYQEAFTMHRANFKGKKRLREETVDQDMKVERWKSSLDEAFKLAGWHIHDYDDEDTNIERITRVVLEKLNCQLEGEMKSTSMVGQTSEDYLEKIMQCMMNNENPKVGVWGMGGVGKTTIVTHINNILRKDASFSNHIYWVTVSKDSSVSKLQRAIAKEIKLDLSGEENEGKIAAKLFNKLNRINKFVLILDDVWEPFETEDVGIPLMGGKKLLLTTRDLGVCQRMMCQPIEVKPLSEREALDLFMKESKSQINDSQELREIVHSIVKECAGLPLAIVVVARRMRGVGEIWKWRNTLQELQKPRKGENSEMEKKVYNPLQFSYDNLPSARCRQCFLYCSLFPEDYKFDRDCLIDYWIGERLINKQDTRQAELDEGNVILDELIHSSLLGKYYDKIQMHDVIRDMARINVKGGLQFEDPLESIQVLDEKMLKSFPISAPHGSKLKTLVLQGHPIMQLSGCLFANMQSLNVLHIENVKSIPDCITNLGNLRVLIINFCRNLECIPSLVGLKNLRYLEISDTVHLREMPKGIESLVNLRVLDLSWNESLSESCLSGVVEKLSHLQTLDLVGSRIEVEAEVLISLEKLEILRVEFYYLNELECYVKSEHWHKLLDYEIHYGMGGTSIRNWKKGMFLKEIRDVEELEESGILLLDDIQYLELVEWKSPMFYVFKNPTFAHLQIVSFYECTSKYLFTVDFAQQLLHNVQKLHISSCLELEEIIATEEEWGNQNNCINYTTIVLPKLKILELICLVKLRSIYRGRMVCPSLELIEIDELSDKVERLPFCMKKEGNKQNPTIKLRGSLGVWNEDDPVSRRWWDSLRWDDPNAKSMYHPTFSEGESEHESESGDDTE